MVNSRVLSTPYRFTPSPWQCVSWATSESLLVRVTNWREWGEWTQQYKMINRGWWRTTVSTIYVFFKFSDNNTEERRMGKKKNQHGRGQTLSDWQLWRKVISWGYGVKGINELPNLPRIVISHYICNCQSSSKVLSSSYFFQFHIFLFSVLILITEPEEDKNCSNCCTSLSWASSSYCIGEYININLIPFNACHLIPSHVIPRSPPFINKTDKGSWQVLALRMGSAPLSITPCVRHAQGAHWGNLFVKKVEVTV